MHAPKHTKHLSNQQLRDHALQPNQSNWRSSKTLKPDHQPMGQRQPLECPAPQQGSTISLHELLLKDRDRILRSNLELEHFATLAAHDLKSPLHAAFSWFNILIEQLPHHNSSALDESIGIIQRNLKNAMSYVDELLQIAKIKEQPVKREACIVSKIVSDVINVHSAALKDANARVHYGNLLEINANPKHLECVFSNLLGNSIKYKHPNRDLIINVGATEHDSFIEYFVKDNGIGIPAARLDNIFTLFESYAPGSQELGTGVGLAFCRKVIRLHGGTIWAESSDGYGTTIKIQLPKTASKS